MTISLEDFKNDVVANPVAVIFMRADSMEETLDAPLVCGITAERRSRFTPLGNGRWRACLTHDGYLAELVEHGPDCFEVVARFGGPFEAEFFFKDFQDEMDGLVSSGFITCLNFSTLEPLQSWKNDYEHKLNELEAAAAAPQAAVPETIAPSGT